VAAQVAGEAPSVAVSSGRRRRRRGRRRTCAYVARNRTGSFGIRIVSGNAAAHSHASALVLVASAELAWLGWFVDDTRLDVRRRWRFSGRVGTEENFPYMQVQPGQAWLRAAVLCLTLRYPRIVVSALIRPCVLISDTDPLTLLTLTCPDFQSLTCGSHVWQASVVNDSTAGKGTSGDPLPLISCKLIKFRAKRGPSVYT
jgi:hypothetical protein